MTDKELKELAAKKRAEALLNSVKAGSLVRYGSYIYEVARKECGRVVIYDEAPSKHEDMINPSNLTLVRR